MTIRDFLEPILDTSIHFLIFSIIGLFIIIRFAEKYASFLERFKSIRESFWLSVIIYTLGIYIVYTVFWILRELVIS